MVNYILRRLAQSVPQLFLISLILFLLMQAFGDPIASLGVRTPPRPADRERLRRQLGLDQPVYVQYLVWLIGNDWMKIDMDGDGVGETPGKRLGVLRGDFGNSLISKRPVLELITERLPNTLLLMVTAEVVIIIFSLVVGVYSAVKQYSLIDNLITGLSFVGFSMPIFLIALLSMYLFSLNFKEWGLPYLPTVGMFDPEEGRTPSQIALHMILPVLSLSIISIAGYSRYVRSSMLEILGLDYIRTARAKGLREKLVVMKHALRNAMLPFVTLIGLDIPFLLAGAVVTETIFAWPGTGRLFVERTAQSDFPVLMGILMMTGVAVVIFQLLTDIAYSYLDPRIRIE
ncbi:MAG TPA: ABC transporter permease [Anaerolineales bacterium]|nr:ABC transporter permease [Anaerolineales bacterium]